jgi:hypothetical protein
MQLLTSAAAYTLGITATQVGTIQPCCGAQEARQSWHSWASAAHEPQLLTSMLCAGRCWVSAYASPAAPPYLAHALAYWVWALRLH